jgi:hypothetical protein
MDPLNLPPLYDRLQFYTLYETKMRYYLVGGSPISKLHKQYKILKIDRFSPNELNLDCDEKYYDEQSINSILHMTSAIKVCTVYGIIGFIRFVSGYYMFLITSVSPIGSIGRHQIYTINETQLIYITNPSCENNVSINSKLEAKYRQLFLMLDCSKNFYFSYTYPLTQTLQFNMIHSKIYENNYKISYQDERDMYIWNNHMLNQVKQVIPNYYREWTIILIHGYIEQCNFSVFGRVFSVTIISRRSRLFAGTRYLKRGINEAGCTANDVETEQILHDKSASSNHSLHFTSHVQMRGSIPVHWAQEGLY